jgi:hypothetical protein
VNVGMCILTLMLVYHTCLFVQARPGQIKADELFFWNYSGWEINNLGVCR